MLKQSILLLLLFILHFTAAQEVLKADFTTKEDVKIKKKWEYEINISANFFNIGLYNWNAGGATFLSANSKNTLVWNWNGNKIFWFNRILINYGGLYNYKPSASFPYRKTDDLLSYMTSLGYILNKRWILMIFGNYFKTQFAPGYVYKITNEIESQEKITDILSPAYNYTYTGVRYKYEEKKTKFTIIDGPLAFQQVIVQSKLLADQGLAGVKKGKHWLGNVGWMLDALYEQGIYKDMRFWSHLNLFGRYTLLQGITINWETGLELRLIKYFFLNFNTELIYDYYTILKKDDGSLGRGVQFKYLLNFGLAMKFSNMQ